MVLSLLPLEVGWEFLLLIQSIKYKLVTIKNHSESSLASWLNFVLFKFLWRGWLLMKKTKVFHCRDSGNNLYVPLFPIHSWLIQDNIGWWSVKDSDWTAKSQHWPHTQCLAFQNTLTTACIYINGLKGCLFVIGAYVLVAIKRRPGNRKEMQKHWVETGVLYKRR